MIYKKIQLFFNAKKRWTLPEQTEVIFFDINCVDILKNFIPNKTYSVLYTRGEVINLFIFLLARLNPERYFQKYIQSVAPNIVITATDNDDRFYKLKAIFPDIIFIAIQNGHRTERGDIFSRFKKVIFKRSCDYILTFNESIAEEYQKYIDTNTVPIGSFKNNFYQKLNKIGTKLESQILFISQYAEIPDGGEGSYFQKILDRSVSWSEVFEAEKVIMEYLRQFSEMRGIEFSILLRQDMPSSEINFYEKLFKGKRNYSFIKKNSRNSYQIIDNYKYVIGIDSTLLFESFARRNRTAFFPFRERLLGCESCKFGWPKKNISLGQFWTNSTEIGEFFNTMDFIINSSDKEWDEIYKKSVNDIMLFDPGNKKLSSVLKALI